MSASAWIANNPHIQQMLQQRAQSPQGMAQRGLSQAGDFGFFSPQGSPLINEQVRAEAIRNQRNQLQRGGVLSQLMGLDPQQAAVARLQAEQGAGNQLSGALNQNRLQQSLGNQSWFRQLFGQQLDYQHQREIAKMQADAQKQQQGGGWGSLIGAGIGALIPGGGALGGLFGGGYGGGSNMPHLGQPGYNPWG